jgi:NAD-dependent SIR2 family protein deacetylase
VQEYHVPVAFQYYHLPVPISVKFPDSIAFQDFRSDGRHSSKNFFDLLELGDASVMQNACKFFGLMREKTLMTSPSETHAFLLALNLTGKILRIYTQNIDGLEDKVGIPLVEAPHHKHIQGGHVRLHGTLQELLCRTCSRMTPFTQFYLPLFLGGKQPECYFCEMDSKSPLFFLFYKPVDGL